MQLVGGLDAVAALEVGQGLASIGRGAPSDHFIVFDLVLGDLPWACEDGEQGDDAEAQADGDCRAEGKPPACVEMTPSAVVTEEKGEGTNTGSASACAQRWEAPVRTARPDHRSFYLVVVLGSNWLAGMLKTVLLAGWKAALASVLLRPKAGTKETSWMTCSFGDGCAWLCILDGLMNRVEMALVKTLQ